MAKEQKDYRQKQQDGRSNTQPSFTKNFADFESFTHEKLFKDFFADREEWRQRVPNLFGKENHLVADMMNQMDNLMRSVFFSSASRYDHNPHTAYSTLNSELRAMQEDLVPIRKRQARLSRLVEDARSDVRTLNTFI